MSAWPTSSSKPSIHTPLKLRVYCSIEFSSAFHFELSLVVDDRKVLFPSYTTPVPLAGAWVAWDGMRCIRKLSNNPYEIEKGATQILKARIQMKGAFVGFIIFHPRLGGALGTLSNENNSELLNTIRWERIHAIAAACEMWISSATVLGSTTNTLPAEARQRSAVVAVVQCQH